MESMSWFLRLTELHLNQTFDSAYVLAEKGLSVRGINLPAFHGPTVFFTLSWSWSPLTFLVCWNVALSSTPTKSRWSESCTYWCGRSSWERVPFHLPEVVSEDTLATIEKEKGDLEEINRFLKQKAKDLEEECETVYDTKAVDNMLYEDFKERMKEKYEYSSNDTESDYESDEETRERNREKSRENKRLKKSVKNKCDEFDFTGKTEAGLTLLVIGGGYYDHGLFLPRITQLLHRK